MNDETFTIADLARLTGINVRTIRYYLAQGLLPASGESGPGAHYGEGHLGRLRLTKRLQAQHLPLSEIRARLAALSDEEIAQLVADAGTESPAPETSALEYVRSLLEKEPAPGAGRAARMFLAVPAPPAASGPMPFAALPTAPAAAAAAIAAAIEAEDDKIAPGERRPTEPQSLERSQWERLSLGPNLELHVRRPLSRLEQRRVERLITIARQVLNEDQS